MNKKVGWGKVARPTDSDWLKIEDSNPRPVKMISSWVRVSRNHPAWTSQYSVEVRDRGWGIFSQHSKLSTAVIAAQKVAKKYKSGRDALTNN